MQVKMLTVVLPLLLSGVLAVSNSTGPHLPPDTGPPRTPVLVDRLSYRAETTATLLKLDRAWTTRTQATLAPIAPPGRRMAESGDHDATKQSSAVLAKACVEQPLPPLRVTQDTDAADSQCSLFDLLAVAAEIWTDLSDLFLAANDTRAAYNSGRPGDIFVIWLSVSTMAGKIVKIAFATAGIAECVVLTQREYALHFHPPIANFTSIANLTSISDHDTMLPFPANGSAPGCSPAPVGMRAAPEPDLLY